jgi:hypothetical protein
VTTNRLKIEDPLTLNEFLILFNREFRCKLESTESLLAEINFDSLDHLDLVLFTEETATGSSETINANDYPLLLTISEAYAYYLTLISSDELDGHRSVTGDLSDQ